MHVLPGCFNKGDVLYLPFDTYDSNGASVTITGLAVTDIEIYKDGSTTQRASDNGYTLLDTDGIDFDGTTGLHGFSVDTGDNSDAGFWADGHQYWINVNAITVDSQTVRFTYFLALGYSLRPTTAGRTLDVSSGGEAGVDWANVGSPTTTLALTGTTIATTQKVDVETIKTNAVVNGGTITFPSNATLASTTNITGGTITTVTTVTNQLTAAQIATGVWQDSTAGDFTAASSIGKALYVSNIVPGAAGGHFIAGTNAATTVNITGDITGNLSGSIGSYTGNTPQTGDSYARLGAPTGLSISADITSKTAAILTGTLTEAYPADGAAGTLTSNIFLLRAMLCEPNYSGTTATFKKIDGSATAAVLTLDDGTTPTSATRTT